MSGFYKVSGTWKGITSISAKVSGAWKRVLEGYQKLNGEWVRVYIGLVLSETGVQIGDLIITSDEVWYDSGGNAAYTLLETGQTFDENLFPLLYEVYGTSIIPSIPDATGSPFPYKMVADLQQ